MLLLKKESNIQSIEKVFTEEYYQIKQINNWNEQDANDFIIKNNFSIL
jgi:hypothetical protein